MMIRILFTGLIAATALNASQPDVQKIGEKIDALKALDSSPKMAYRVYDPFKQAKPLLLEKSKKEVPKTEQQTLRLDAIMNDKAFINGKWLKEGDRILGSKIIRIKPYSILVRTGGKSRLIPLAKGRTLVTTKDKDQ